MKTPDAPIQEELTLAALEQFMSSQRPNKSTRNKKHRTRAQRDARRDMQKASRKTNRGVNQGKRAKK